MKNYYFILTPEIGMEFFEECDKRKIAEDDALARTKLLVEIGRKYSEFRIIETDRNNKEIIKDLSKHYENILHLEREEE